MTLDSPSQFSRHRAFISSSMSAPIFPTFSPSSSRSSSPNPNPNLGFSSSSSSSRLLSSPSFSHNGRIALALIPSAAFLLDLGGTPVIATLTLGLMLSYILDSFRLQTASFFAVWFSLIASQLAFFFSASFSFSFSSLPLTLLALLLCALTTFLIGIWLSLHFKWVQIENPTMTKTLERLLFAYLPVSAPALFTWAAVSALGMANAAYYLMVFSCVYYWVFSIPRPSGFRSKQDLTAAGPNEDRILGPLESCVHTVHLVFVPVLFRIGSHHTVIFSSISALCDVLLLFFIPFLFQLYASTRGALWWVTRDGHHVHRIRVVNGAVAMVVVVICLEIRIVFQSFGWYLHAPPPLNYLLVTLAMLGGSSAVGAYAVGVVEDAVSSAAFTAVTVLVSGAGAIVVGFPILLWIAGIHSASLATSVLCCDMCRWDNNHAISPVTALPYCDCTDGIHAVVRSLELNKLSRLTHSGVSRSRGCGRSGYKRSGG